MNFNNNNNNYITNLKGEEGSEKRTAIENMVGTELGIEAEEVMAEYALHSGKATFTMPFFLADKKILKDRLARWPV
jgi:hypothetical protein